MAADAKSDAAILAGQVRGGDRRALARAITLVESTRADHREAAEHLVAALLPDTGRAIRVGISGPPGAGKSTFIEAFGLQLLEAGRKPAVLAVDPSSPVSGGSILGDKTRMEYLSRDERAFIRPSPSGGTLGGVARRTREAALVCEAAGFDTLLIETVGVGQSETAVAEMVDLFMLLLPPAGGDELQGIKKGIVELADLVVINKDDGDLAPAAGRTAAEYGAALHMLRPASSSWHPPVLRVSALHRKGMEAVWGQILAHREALGPAGLATKRAGQARAVLWREIEEEVRGRLAAKGALQGLLERLETDISQGLIGPALAARQVVDALAKPGS